jgi:DNA repair exonuclease SbcCD nuclease subunit
MSISFLNCLPLDLTVRVGDLHVGRNQNSLEMFNVTKEFYEKILIPLVKDLSLSNPNRNISIIFLGDQFDKKQTIDVTIFCYFLSLNLELAKINNVQLFFLVGNHDTPFTDKIEINANFSFSLIKNSYIIDKPFYVNGINGRKNLLIPYMHDKNQFNSFVSQAKEDGCYNLYGHNDIYGFSKEGLPVEKENNLSVSDFHTFNEVIMGHIHTRQTIKNVKYIGSPYQTRWQEQGNSNYIEVYDYLTNELKVIENKISPKYLVENYVNLINKEVNEAKEILSNKFVRLLVPGSLKPFNTNFISSNIDSYKSIRFDPIGTIYNDDFEESQNNEFLSINDYYNKFINELSAVILEKQEVVLNDVVKDFLVKKFDDLYREFNKEITD